MKQRTQIILAGALLIAVMAWSAARRGPRSNNAGQGCGTCCPFLPAPGALLIPSVTNGTTINAPNQQVVAYYFHGTVRCETCLKIEQQAKAVIERQFKQELDTQRLVFIPLNYDLPANSHFLLDYKLPCPSLVLIRQKDGKDVQRTMLGDTWQLIEDPVKFNAYIETEARNFLNGQEQQTRTNKVESPPKSDHR